MRCCIDKIRRGGVSPPVRGAYLVDGTLPSGEGGNDTQGTLHALEARTAGRDGRPVPYEIDRYNVANRAGQGSNDTQRTKHELSVGTADPSGLGK